MTNCPEVSELRRLLDGDSSAEDVGELVRHVDGCPTCLQRLDEFTRQNALPLAARAAAVCRTPESDGLMAHLVRTIPAPAPLTWAHDPKEPRDPVPPAIPGFEQLELVGRGGSGQVYRAWQPSCARWVALKVLNPGRSLGRSPRVLREARFLGRLNHRHVVRILDSGAHAGQPYLVMEWISGGSLHDRLRQGPLSIQESAQLGEQVASALAAVHALGIVHRDLKPANVLLEEPGADVGGRMAKLTDFGIARDEENEERLTSTGMILGTPQYMSPEQTGLLPETTVVGPASDIYGVGAVLFACLTGQPPRRGRQLWPPSRGSPRSKPRAPNPSVPRFLRISKPSLSNASAGIPPNAIAPRGSWPKTCDVFGRGDPSPPGPTPGSSDSGIGAVGIRGPSRR